MKKEDKIKQKRGGTILYSKLKRLVGALSLELQHSLVQVNGWRKVGVGPLRFCLWGQRWSQTWDWTGCFIEKQGGSGGGKVGKKCE